MKTFLTILFFGFVIAFVILLTILIYEMVKNKKSGDETMSEKDFVYISALQLIAVCVKILNHIIHTIN